MIAIRHLCALTLLLCAAPGATYAAQSVRSGDWADPATWGGAVPGSTEDAIIRAGHTVTLTTEPPRASVQVDSGGSLLIAETGRLQICVGCVFSNSGSVEVSGTLTLGEDSSGATYRNWAAFLVNAGGSVVVTRNAIFENAQRTLTNNGHITNNGQLKNVRNGNSMLINNGTIDNNGILLNDVEMTNTGTITIGLVDIDLGLFSSSYRFYSDGGTITTYPGAIWTSTEIFNLTDGARFYNYGSFRPTGGIHHILSGSEFHNHNEVAGATSMMADGGIFYTYCDATQNTVYGTVVDVCADTLFKNGME
ncbi:hypothetical protein DFR29_10248 [Tahibacter aquaticus]|uniref:G8 domain-containing protein n=1 Tax=Tahibacter aquaticus TaxID=520092 RepID=A0A4R6Z734_9GAMM|nr:hypothetical protein [Tahibacter aquaticus]TDR47389.1 hypothetical protein DFR29_10248 [Tahibacter aquaticus]